MEAKKCFYCGITEGGVNKDEGCSRTSRVDTDNLHCLACHIKLKNGKLTKGISPLTSVKEKGKGEGDTKMEARFKVGDRVKRVAGGANRWGASMEMEDIATVERVNGYSISVRIDSSKRQQDLYESELELVNPASKFKVGDKVKVPAHITKPSGGWGEVKRGDVGTVTEVRGNLVLVKFPAQSCWSTVPEHLELAPPASKFKVGDYVRWNRKGNRFSAVTPAGGKVSRIEREEDTTPDRQDKVYVQYCPGEENYYHPDELDLVKEPKPDTGVELTPAFKVFRLDGDKIVSIYAGSKLTDMAASIPTIEYKVGEVATAPAGQCGLAVFTSLNSAEMFAQSNRGGVAPRRWTNVVHEVTVIGDIKRGEILPLGSNQADTCRALVVGKRVVDAEPEPSAKVWRDITGDCTIRVSRGSDGSNWISILHNGSEIFLSGMKGFVPYGTKTGSYRLTPTREAYPCGCFKIEMIS